MADTVINAQQVVAAGQGYKLAAAQEILLKAARASYDGTGAAGSFVPTLQIVSDSGVVVAECPVSATVSAGASADVSWFPEVSAQASSAGGSGIQFDTNPQSGDWLYWNTTGAAGPPSGYGLHIQDASAAGILIEATGASSSNLLIENDNGDVTISADTGNLSVTSGGTHAAVFGTTGDAQTVLSSAASGGIGVLIRDTGNGSISIDCTGTGSIFLTVGTGANLNIVGLPTVNPGGTGNVWNSAGVLHIT